MKTSLTITTLAACSFLQTVRAEETSYPPINPALHYWQAAAELPKLSDEQAKELRDMAVGRLPIDPVKIDAMGFEAAEHLLRKAAASPAPCDWGLPLEDGAELTLPHVAKVRELANIATVKGEALLVQGKTAAGLDWLLAAHRIARHAGSGGILISFLVQTSIEEIALRAAGRHCLAWDAATRHGYADKLKALPPLHSLPEAYRGELVAADCIEGLARLDEPERQAKLKVLFSSTPIDEVEKYRAQLKPEVIQKTLAEWRSVNRRAMVAFSKPWKEARPELDAIAEAAKHSEFVVVQQNVPAAVTGPPDKVFAITTLQTMLDAVLRHGAKIDEATAATYVDAFEGKPLRLKRANDSAFSLIAAEPHPKGQDIELKLGN